METKDLFEKLYNGSAFTIEGADLSNGIDEWIDGINNMLSEKEISAIPKEDWYTFKGKDMNEYYKLTGNNQYPNDLTFLSFTFNSLDREEMGKLAFFKMEFGARWFDDIVDNNRRREE